MPTDGAIALLRFGFISAHSFFLLLVCMAINWALRRRQASASERSADWGSFIRRYSPTNVTGWVGGTIVGIIVGALIFFLLVACKTTWFALFRATLKD
jgi:hypothetical protein